jgi:hypothetical protein
LNFWVGSDGSIVMGDKALGEIIVFYIVDVV